MKIKIEKTHLGIRLSKVYKSTEANEDKLKKYIDDRYIRDSKKRS
jgi:hypothetical protein